MANTILVLINGRSGVGKDTFVKFCQEYAEAERLCKVYNIHRSDAPKIALYNIGWDGEKDTETRELLKHMVDYMESKGLLSQYLKTHIKKAKKEVPHDDVIIFYHVRNPEVIYALVNEYTNTDIEPVSVLIKRETDEEKEPNEWWENLENAEYQITLKLPNSLEVSKSTAKNFVDFLLIEKVV